MMNKQEFLHQLELGLSTVPAEERVAALQYYTEYFDDAGPEREAEVIAEIGSPDQLAADIRAESGAPAPVDNGPLDIGAAPAAPEPPPVYVQQPVADPAQAEAFQQGQQAAQNMMRRTSFSGGQNNSYTGAAYGQPNTGYTGYPQGYGQPAETGSWKAGKLVLFIILLVFLSPFIGTFASILFGAFMICLIPCIVGFALGFSGAAVAIASFVLLQVSLGHMLVMFGIGLMLLAIGLLLFYTGCKVIGRIVPAFIGMLKSIFTKLASSFKGVPSHG